MAMDKSKENSRIEWFLNMNVEAQRINIIKGIKNPAILKRYLNDEGTEVIDYAMAAGLIDRDDAKWMKENPGEANPK